MKRFLFPACVLLIIAGCTGSREPSSAARPLSFWVKALDQEIENLKTAQGAKDGLQLIKVIDALGAYGAEAKAIAPRLAGLLINDNPAIRVSAMETLGGMKADAVPALLAVYQNGTLPERVRAGLVLAAIGPDAKEAIPAVEKALKDPSPVIRDWAAKVLDAIKPETETTTPEKTAITVDPAKLTLLPMAETRAWPQFHGPQRNSISNATGLLTEWPEAGPPLLWKIENLGKGFSSVSIANGKIITMGDRAMSAGGSGQFVIAFDLATQKELWATQIGPAFTRGDEGPRSTPTMDGGWIYALGTEGDLVCLAAANGDIRWRKHLVKDFDGVMMSGWKYSESPLIDGNKLICTPGAADAVMVALDKSSGETLWKCPAGNIGEKGKDGAGYSSMIVADIEGVRQCIQLYGRGVIGVDAATGRLLWHYNKIANNIANIPSPACIGNYIFVTTGYNTGAALLEISKDGNAFQAKEVYFIPPSTFQNHHGGVVVADEHVYGGSGTNKGAPVCINIATGKVAWTSRPPQRGSASVLYADGHIIFRYDRGLVQLVEANAKAYTPKGSFTPPLGEDLAWAHPVIHDGKLYLRHGDILACYNLKKGP